MTKRTTMAAVLAAGLLAAGGAALAGEAHDHSTHAASPGLEALKGLEGSWVKIDDAGQPTEEVVSVFSVTAGGSAVREVLFPGTAHEMVTMYHQDGDALVLTHYCAEGNQPRMKAKAPAETRALVFECQGGSNMASEDDRHMHEGRITILGPDRIKAEWLQHANGEHTYTAVFELARRD